MVKYVIVYCLLLDERDLMLICIRGLLTFLQVCSCVSSLGILGPIVICRARNAFRPLNECWKLSSTILFIRLVGPDYLGRVEDGG